MIREISAGGVVVKRAGDEGWSLAVIEPQSGTVPGRPAGKTRQKVVVALPKGLVDPGERPEETALREVREETGLIAGMVAKLGDIKYVYSRSWGDGQRVFKIVSFFLLRYLAARSMTWPRKCGWRCGVPAGFRSTKRHASWPIVASATW
jgi:8-oxo-dGTP pyrophosphatase MutT (NUDIX family)